MVHHLPLTSEAAEKQFIHDMEVIGDMVHQCTPHYGNSLIHYAAYLGDVVACKILMGDVPFRNFIVRRNAAGYTPLAIAILCDHSDCVEVLYPWIQFAKHNATDEAYCRRHRQQREAYELETGRRWMEARKSLTDQGIHVPHT